MSTKPHLGRTPFQHLPLELVHAVFLEAAKSSISENRERVVDLASVSRTVYKLVRPVLYRTMVITRENHHKVYKLAVSECSERVFSAVRRLAVFCDRDDLFSCTKASTFDRKMLHRLFASVTDIKAPLYFIALLADFELELAPGTFRPRHIVVADTDRFKGIKQCGLEPLKSVTHISGPYHYDAFQIPGIGARGWVLNLLRSLPSVTHIAFHRVDVHSRTIPQTFPHVPISPRVVEELVCTLLRIQRIARVVMHVGGERLRDLSLLEELQRKINDARFCVWADTRDVKYDTDVEDYAIQDAWRGKDVWTESGRFRRV